jgi:hypothetical protein
MSNKTIIWEALEYGKQLRPRSPLFAAALAELDREEGPVAHAHLPPGVDPIDDVAHHVVLSFDHLKPYEDNEDDEAAESSAYAERLEEVGAILAHAWSYAVQSGYAYAAPPAPVDLSEIVEAGNNLRIALDNFLCSEANQEAFKFSEAWTAVTAKHRKP